MTVPHHYSMKWDNYHSHVGDIFSQLLETGSMADVILYAEGEKINCHKMLLSACSPYFQEILSSAGGSNTIVVVSGISGQDVRSIIEFVYRGEISVKADRFGSVLKAAEALKICGLMEVNSHLSEMEVSEGSEVGDKKPERNSASNVYKGELPKKARHKRFVTVKDENKCGDEGQPTRWNNIEMPVAAAAVDSYAAAANIFSNGVEVNADNGKLITASNDEGGRDRDREGERITTLDQHNLSDTSRANLKIKIESNIHNEEVAAILARQDGIAVNSEEEFSCEDHKLKKRKDIRKKLYSEEAMLAALEDMKAGKNLVKAAAKHRVPRTTLYMRARAIGACPAMVRKGYPMEKITAALESVASGSSLQCAATEFGIPKTVLWRRVQKEMANSPIALQTKRVKQNAATTATATAKETLVQDGILITRVSPQYQIPKATLFRWEKVHVSNNNANTEETLLKNDERVKSEIGNAPVQLDGDEPRKGGVAATSAHTVHQMEVVKQSSVWSNIERDDAGSSGEQFPVPVKANDDCPTAIDEQLKQQQSDFNFSEGVDELAVSYVNSQLTDSSIIILAPVEGTKYTLQREDQPQQILPDSMEKALQPIKIESALPHADEEEKQN